MGTIKFILNIIAWGITLALLGILPQMTRFFRTEAVKAHSVGLISLGKVSRRLETK